MSFSLAVFKPITVSLCNHNGICGQLSRCLILCKSQFLIGMVASPKMSDVLSLVSQKLGAYRALHCSC